MALTLIITDAGRAALVNAQHNGTAAVQIAAFGVTATAIVASAATATLPGEVKRIATISGATVAATVIHLTVRDESADAYTMRSFALYLTDGTLFASFGQADTILEKTAKASLLLAVDITLADIAAAQITFGNTDFLNPPATTETAGVVELATDAEAIAANDSVRATTPRGVLAAIVAKLASWGSDIWRASNDGAGSGLDADLLDGQQGSWYADIAARLGYTPANAAGQVFTGPIRRDAQFYMDLKSGGNEAVLNFDAFQYIVYDRMLRQLSFRIADRMFAMGNAGLQMDGSPLWHAGNDGSGSGLDADLLDGLHGSAYDRVVSYGVNELGVWRQFSDGRMEMYGVVYLGAGSHYSFTAFDFPTAFPNACQGITGNARGRCNANWAPINVVFEWDSTHNATCLAHSGNVDQAIDGGKTIPWRAWGY